MDRPLVARNGKFMDAFKAYDVHLYQIKAPPAEPGRAGR
jgi:hypothetical protein